MLIGYARVSTLDQNTGLQIDALKGAGCERIYTDEGMSGKTTSRPELDQCLAALQPGDTLVVWRLDRLGRSLVHLIETVAVLKDRGIGFRSLTEAMDTSSAAGELIFHVFGALTQFERRLIIERTQAGLQAAKARGKKLGRRHLLGPIQIDGARAMIRSGMTPTAAARAIGVSRATLYRALAPSQERDPSAC